MAYVLPNRQAFSEFVVRIFRKYRDVTQGDKSSRDLFDYQKLVRDYLLMETPYRGLLLYHGLGSGKTCSSIAVAESLLHDKKVYILTPASLQSNYRQEIRKCGDPIYAFEQHWEIKPIRSSEDREQAKSMGISDKFLDQNGRFFVTISDRQPNYNILPTDVKKAIASQVDDLINQRFNFINYNGISSQNVDEILPSNFDDCVLIIDEAHNLIGSVVNERGIKQRLYELMYIAKNTKIVCLSGTPMINKPQEIAFLMNLLKGPIQRVTIPTSSAVSWDEEAMTRFFRSIHDVDTIEYNSVKRMIMLTRNPPFFESVYNEKGERIAVKYNKNFPQEVDIKQWAIELKPKFEQQIAGVEFAEKEKFFVENLECLPTQFEDFMNTFIDGLSVRNPMLFARRIQGLVSYYRGADEKLLPKRIDEDTTLTKIPMSSEQFYRYLEERNIEIQRESRKSRNPSLNDDFGSYRASSRLVCNYAVPPEMRVVEGESSDENTIISKPEIIAKMKALPDKYLSPAALKLFSPKMERMLEDITKNIGKPNAFRNQLVYSQYKSLEGIGLFGAVLEANGFQRYRLIKKGPSLWEEDPNMKEDVPAYAMYSGDETEEEKELYRQIFNEKYSDTFPSSLKDSLGKRKLCILMISSSGAEGITLNNVRNVYIMEPYWNPARIDQVIGRAIRLYSHESLPPEERTVKVQLYLSVFTEDQMTTTEGPNIVAIRRNDMVLKRYDGGEPREVFMSSDEYLYEVSYRKSRIIKNISHLLKQAAVDCEIHRKLHSKETPIIQCMRFDTTSTGESLAYNPDYKTDERDTLYMRNIQRKTRRLQIVKAKGIVFILDPDTNEIFDSSAFQDTKRLIRLGIRSAPGEIRFFTV